MFSKLREKAHVFWLRHRGAIIGFGVFAVGTIGVGMAVSSYVNKKDAEHVAAEAEAEEARKKAKEEAEVEEEKIDHAFACGGQIESASNNWLDDPDYPGALINTVPVSSMGEFGKEILDFTNEIQFGEFAEEHGFKPETATVDVMIDFGHQMWKMRNPEEATEESQEKQAS